MSQGDGQACVGYRVHRRREQGEGQPQATHQLRSQLHVRGKMRANSCRSHYLSIDDARSRVFHRRTDFGPYSDHRQSRASTVDARSISHGQVEESEWMTIRRVNSCDLGSNDQPVTLALSRFLPDAISSLTQFGCRPRPVHSCDEF